MGVGGYDGLVILTCGVAATSIQPSRPGGNPSRWYERGSASHACGPRRGAVRGSVGLMSEPIVTLATCADFPELDDDDRGLPDALRARGIEPRIAVWNDPDVDWSQAGTVVLRSVRDYATKGNYSGFLQWARSVPRLANHPDVVTWNSDKHYLTRLSEWGVPMIPTTWLEPEACYSKHQVHTRFPAHGDFVVKPAVSSGGRGTGRYTATNASSRSAAINDAMHHLRRGRTVMVQRYLEEVDRKGEVSLVYFNGVLSHAVE